MPGMYPIDLGLTGLQYEYTPYQFGGDFYDGDGAGAAASNNAIEVMYSVGDFSAHVSASDGANERIAAHVAYKYSGYTFALGAQDSNSASDTDFAASVSGNIGPAMVSLAYADNGTNGDHITLAARFDVGAATNIEAYISDADTIFGTPTENVGYGIDFNHDMGGGTSLRGGVAKMFLGHTVADLGVRFNF